MILLPIQSNIVGLECTKALLKRTTLLESVLLKSLGGFINKNPRPVFTCGHSLRGALATICSLDLRLSLNIPAEDMNVSTFESPRSGTKYFEMFQLTGDSHTKTMRDETSENGRVYVGKQEMLTSSRNLFLDPDWR